LICVKTEILRRLKNGYDVVVPYARLTLFALIMAEAFPKSWNVWRARAICSYSIDIDRRRSHVRFVR